MKIQTTLVPSRDPPSFSAGSLAIVIDVLRATSVMATAIFNGANVLVTAADVDDARDYRGGDSSMLRGGERMCRRIEGFDFGNSPAEYGHAVNGRDIVMTTTNGTAAIEWASGASELITAAFVNRSSAIGRAMQFQSVHLICSGTDAMVSGEDVLLAGEIVTALIREDRSIELDDSSIIAGDFWRSSFGDASAVDVSHEDLTAKLGQCRGGQNLIQRGFGSDLSICAAVDSHPAVPTRVESNPPQFRIGRYPAEKRDA